jgi:ribosomal protein L29
MTRAINELKKLNLEDLMKLEASIKEDMLKDKANQLKSKEKPVKRVDLRKKLARVKTLINQEES